MNLQILAADLAARCPELARDSMVNRETIIAGMLREALEPPTESESRARFERWAYRCMLGLKRYSDGNYEDPAAIIAWQAWQEAQR